MISAQGRSVFAQWKEMASFAEPRFYRLSAFLTVSCIDDPAWLALIFC